MDSNSIKIGVISDLHGNLPKIEPCEFLFICGDIVPLDIQHNHYASEIWFRSIFASWVNSLPCTQVIIVPGNHDKYLEDIKDVPTTYYETFTRATRNKCEVLYNKQCNLVSSNGEVFKVFGTPYCPIFGNWSFMEDSKSLKEHFKEIPYNCDFLISHSPPYGVCDKVIGTKKRCGSKELQAAIKEKQPKYCFCGHIHTGNHECEKIGVTKVYNTSLLDESYTVFYNILYLTI